MRLQHEGTLEELPSGLFRYRGKVSGVRVSGLAKATKTAAMASFRAKVFEALAPKERASTRPTVADYVYETLGGAYKERVKTGRLADSTWALYEIIYRRHIELDLLGQMPVDAVSPQDVERWLSRLMTMAKIDDTGRVIRPSRPISLNSKDRYAGMLSGFFERARVVDKLISVNPVHDAEKPTWVESEFRILNADEIEELLERADAWEAAWSAGRSDQVVGRMRLICLLGLHGLGPAEMCGLERDDLEDGGIWVVRQATRGRIKARLKTRQRRAWVAVEDELAGRIALLPYGYVLRTNTGKPMQEANLRRAFHAMVKGTKFQGLQPYDLRHTFAMRLLIEGVDIRTVSESMRNSPETVLRRYARSNTELKRAAVKKLRRVA